MSFILSDEELIRQLLKHGQEFESKFTRRGQATANANAALNQILESLEGQLHPENKDPNAAPEVSTQSDKPAQLNSTALESLGALANFLAFNKITVDGQLIALTENPNNEAYQFVQLEPNALYNETPDRQVQTKGFYVNIELLKKYLNSLLAHLQQKPNPVMNVQVSKIIDEANKSLDTGLGKTYQPPTPTLNDNAPLDNVPKDFTKNMPATQPGPIPLTFGNIKSLQGFNGWLNGNSISMDGKMINHPQFDKCSIVNILHTRAKAMLGNAQDDKQKNTYTMYVQQVEKLAPSIEGCQLSGSTSTTSGQGQGQGGQGAGATIEQILQELPLRQGDIDFDRIRTFFADYKSFLSAKAAPILSAMENTETAMKNASAMTVSGLENFPMSANLQQIGTWLIEPKGITQANSLIQNLKYVVSNTAAVLAHLKNNQATKLGGQALGQINGQIGDNALGEGIAGSNFNSLQAWQEQADTQQQQLQQPQAQNDKYRGW